MAEPQDQAYRRWKRRERMVPVVVALALVLVFGWVITAVRFATGQPAPGSVPGSAPGSAPAPGNTPGSSQSNSPTTAPATQPGAAPAVAPAPPPVAPALPAAPVIPPGPVIGSHVDEIAGGALVGTWLNDAGAERIEITFYPDGTFIMDGKRGSYMVDGNSVRMTTPRGIATYTFTAGSDVLVISGGDLRADTRFYRHTTLGDYWRGFLEISGSDARRKAVRILVFIVIAFGARFILTGIRRALRFLVDNDLSITRFIYPGNKNRALTIHSLIINAVKYAIYFVTLGFILSEMGVNYTTYLASLSVIGLAIGFGSQGLVQDMVTGFFIVFEDQFDVGDMVEISGQVGVVEEIGLRMTRLRNYIGETMYIPNRNIGVVGNFIQGAQQAMVDVALSANADAAKASQLLQTIGSELARQFPGVFVTQPKALDPVTLETGETFLRLHVSIWPAMVWVLDTQLLPRVLEVFKAKGFEVPGNRIAVSYHARQTEEVGDWRETLGTIRKNLGSFVER